MQTAQWNWMGRITRILLFQNGCSRALVSSPLVKRNEDSGNEIASQFERSFSGAKFNKASINNWKPLFEVNFSKNSTKTIKLFALDFNEVIVDEEYKSKNRHNVEWCFEGVLYFGWPNQPPSGTVEDFTLVRVLCSRYLRNTGNTQK